MFLLDAAAILPVTAAVFGWRNHRFLLFSNLVQRLTVGRLPRRVAVRGDS